MGKGAAAPFNGVHVLGGIRPGGGCTLAESRIAMGGPNWTVYPGRKNQPYHNQPSVASLCLAIGHGTQRRPCLWQRKLWGIFHAWGGGRHGQLVTGRSISMGPPALTPKKHPNQPRLGSVGAESPRERRNGCVLWHAFFRNYGQQGGFKASINCHRVDKFDCSARSLASKT